MKTISKLLLLSVVALSLGMAGCKKKEAAPEAKPDPAAGSGAAAGTGAAPDPGAAAGTGAAPDTVPTGTATPPPATDADFLKVVADHVEEGKGKVDVVFAMPTVVAATFDPANLEGATAELSVEVTSLKSGIDKRDAHLNSPDFLDTAKFPKATVKIANVKPAGDKAYTSDATFSIHGIEKTLPLPFEVVSSTADSVRVKFMVSFARADFGIGAGQDSVKPEVELSGLVTLKKI